MNLHETDLKQCKINDPKLWGIKLYKLMDPKLWGTLPNDILERIAYFADIDSRRILRFLPRKLHCQEIINPLKTIERDFGNNIVVSIDSARGGISWMFGEIPNNVRWVTTTSSMHIMSGGIKGTQVVRHPDFNEDGSFKRCIPIIIN
jgi:hypothetical protein